MIVSINYQLLNFGDKLDGISLLFFGGFVVPVSQRLMYYNMAREMTKLAI